ncbi:S8 family serine peptidase [Mycoplasma seminis]|uniref:S8 family serine peptidase n=1 Tax=Mycoplasma seminis TaxID=512749 RepID=A0ABY9HCQ8_9MOLU|nr:S8 family serine peptidase [Mycoplasma seminis]WLP85979.1 S8 family serine peptidase [Mycoplasma seminis]
MDTNVDLNESYSKVGIIEVNGLKSDDIFNTSNRNNFHIHGGYVSNSNINTLHGSKVYSLIGGDLGINKNSNVYYSSIDMIKNTNMSVNDIDKILKKYPDIFTNPSSKLRNSLDYMVENGVKIVNLSLGYDFFANINKNEDDNVNKIDNLLRNNSELRKFENLYEEFYTLHWLAKIKKFLDVNDLKLDLDDIIDFYNKKYGLTVIAAAGNEGEVYSNIKKCIENIAKYKNLNNMLNSIKKTIEKLHSSKYTTENERILMLYMLNLSKQIELEKYKYDDIFSKVLNTNYNFENKLIEKYDSFIKKTIGNNVIYVGSVGDDLKPSPFSTFTDFENDNLPFVSSYGEQLTNSPRRYTSNWNINNKLDYYQTSAGTSFSAPVITGLISRLQQQFKRTFTLSELKTLLAFGSQISEYNLNTHIIRNGDNDNDYKSEEHINSGLKYGIRRKNNSFSKIGFGVPNYEIIQKNISENRLKKLRIDEENIKNDNFEIELDKWEIENDSRYSAVISYTNLNPLDDKNGLLWTALNNNNLNEKYWDFIIYFKNNLKNFDLLNIVANFDYTVDYQDWIDPYEYYPESIEDSATRKSASNTSSTEKIWIDMPIYGQDDALWMDNAHCYITLELLKELKNLYNSYSNETTIDEKISWDECKKIFIKYFNSLDVTYIISTTSINEKRGS